MIKHDSRVLITVLAHNEEARIAACLNSLPLDVPEVDVCVVVNGSTDATADIVRTYSHRGVILREYGAGGKSLSWNRYILDEAPDADMFVFVDGDAELIAGSVDALMECLAGNPQANAASAMPLNGRNASQYRTAIAREGGMFGDCYALSGDFVARLRASGLRLPEDLVGDDGLIAAFAHTDLGPDSNWDRDRIVICENAGFYCVPNRFSPSGLNKQAKRMTNYAVRRFQNQIITAIMRTAGPAGLPLRLAEIYPAWVPRLSPRFNPLWYWFDRKALAQMRLASRERLADA